MVATLNCFERPDGFERNWGSNEVFRFELHWIQIWFEFDASGCLLLPIPPAGPPAPVTSSESTVFLSGLVRVTGQPLSWETGCVSLASSVLWRMGICQALLLQGRRKGGRIVKAGNTFLTAWRFTLASATQPTATTLGSLPCFSSAETNHSRHLRPWDSWGMNLWGL